MKKRIASALISSMAVTSLGLGALVVDRSLDGQDDFLQILGMSPSYGSKDFSASPQKVATDSPDLTVTKETAAPVVADEKGMPQDENLDIDLSGISEGGGYGPEEHDWNVLNSFELSIPEANLVIPIVESPVVQGSSSDEYEMVLPVSYQAGWLSTSAPLDATQGTTTIAGHVNWANGNWAPMSNLYNVKPGMIVRTTSANGTLTKWKIDDGEPQTVKWENLSEHYDIEKTDGERKLILITCVDSVDANGNSRYDNYVVTAAPIL